MKHFDYIPELDGPQSFVTATGSRILCKGGGGGSSSAPYYANMDRLYGVQSQAAEYMLNNSMPYIPGYMDNSSKMVSDAMDGTLSNQMRQRAGNEATATMGAALGANDRNMQRYGMGFSADRLLSEGNRNAIMGAAGKAGAMNNAAATAEDMKWNRNAGALGQATGMGTGAMDSVGSAARGYGAAAGQMQGYDALNSAGYGKFGGAMAANAFKDGGSVKKPGLHLATGGMPSNNPWTSWKNNNPIQTSQPNGGGGGLGDAVGAVAMGAAPIMIGKGVKAGLSAVKGAMAPAKPAADAAGIVGERGGGAMANGAEPAAEGVSAAPEAAKPGLDTVAAAAPEPTAAATTAGANTAATTAGADAAAVAGTDAAATAGTDLAATAATDVATTAAADTAATAGAAAMGEAAAAGSAAGPVGTAAGLVVGGLMASGVLDDVFAKGGSVKRKNMRPGGKVAGKGTETSDDIPAWLSDGEYVLNAEAVKMVGKEKLDQINDAGLDKRGDKPGLELACGGKVGRKMAGGGFAGIALGAGVDEWDRQKKLGMEQSLTDLRLKLAKPQLDTLDDQAESNRATYKLNTARQTAGLDMLPGQTSNARKQQQIQGIGLDNTLTGYGAQSLSDGNKERGIQIMNESLAAMPGYNGVKVVDVQPAKDGAGVNYVMSDNSTKFVPAAEMQRAMGAMKQGDYQFIHDGAGNVYSGNKANGQVSQQVKGDPAQFNRQHAPAEVQSAEWLMANVPQYKGNPTAAWNAVRSAREKTRTDFVLDYVSKNAMPGQDATAISKQAGDLYDTLRRTQSSSAISDVPGSGTSGAGKSGVNWQDWAAPPQ